MWSEIKSILTDNKTRCVIVEDGKPRYVVIPFEEYQHLQSRKNDSIVEETSVNSELQEVAGSGSINIEDLPF